MVKTMMKSHLKKRKIATMMKRDHQELLHSPTIHQLRRLEGSSRMNILKMIQEEEENNRISHIINIVEAHNHHHRATCRCHHPNINISNSHLININSSIIINLLSSNSNLKGQVDKLMQTLDSTQAIFNLSIKTKLKTQTSSKTINHLATKVQPPKKVPKEAITMMKEIINHQNSSQLSLSNNNPLLKLSLSILLLRLQVSVQEDEMALVQEAADHLNSFIMIISISCN
jgi:hypothetical protein